MLLKILAGIGVFYILLTVVIVVGIVTAPKYDIEEE